MASWEVEFTDQFKAWWETLGVEDQRALTAAVQLLERDGPALGRPLADTIKTSRHPEHEGAAAAGDGPSGALRPRRTAILLIGGSKPRRWQEWYVEYVPLADRLYDEHLAGLWREGELR